MRKGFDSLSGLVRNEMGSNPLGGIVFIFLNRRGTSLKLLHWEADGLVIYHKRLEKGSYSRPQTSSLSWADFVLMIEGIEVEKKVKKRRFSLQKS
jgi:hypothetical protein